MLNQLLLLAVISLTLLLTFYNGFRLRRVLKVDRLCSMSLAVRVMTPAFRYLLSMCAGGRHPTRLRLMTLNGNWLGLVGDTLLMPVRTAVDIWLALRLLDLFSLPHSAISIILLIGSRTIVRLKLFEQILVWSVEVAPWNQVLVKIELRGTSIVILQLIFDSSDIDVLWDLLRWTYMWEAIMVTFIDIQCLTVCHLKPSQIVLRLRSRRSKQMSRLGQVPWWMRPLIMSNWNRCHRVT